MRILVSLLRLLLFVIPMMVFLFIVAVFALLVGTFVFLITGRRPQFQVRTAQWPRGYAPRPPMKDVTPEPEAPDHQIEQ